MISRPELERDLQRMIRTHVDARGPISRDDCRRVGALVAAQLDLPFDDGKLARMIGGAMVACHDAHGPIDERFASSAAKRAVSLLRGAGLWREAPASGKPPVS